MYLDSNLGSKMANLADDTKLSNYSVAVNPNAITFMFEHPGNMFRKGLMHFNTHKCHVMNVGLTNTKVIHQRLGSDIHKL